MPEPKDRQPLPATVKRSRTRAGRRKRPGTGEGSSGLRFDIVAPLAEPNA